MSRTRPGDPWALSPGWPMISSSVTDGVLEIVIDDPDRGNVVDLGWVAGFSESLGSLGADVGCVLIRAEGTDFGRGGDVTSFSGDAPARAVAELVEGVHGVLTRLSSAEVPVVIAVQGWAVGVSFSLVLAADLVVAAPSARFKTAYTGIGLTPDGGMSWTLPRRVPHAVALDLLLTDRSLSSDDALALGIVSRQTSEEDLVPTARELAGRLAAGPRWANAVVKRLVHEGSTRDLPAQLAAEARSITEAIVRPEGAEGVAAFLERRVPRYAAARGDACSNEQG